MIALLRKDRIWLGTAFLVGLGVWGGLFFTHNWDWWWIGATSAEPDFLLAGWIGALLLGLYAGLRDRLLGTREYLLHRAMSPRTVFWTRSLACLALLMVVTLLPPLLSWILPSRNKSVWEWSQLGLLAAVSTSLWTVFAAATYASTAIGRVRDVVVQALVVGGAFFLFARSFFYASEPMGSVSPVGFVLAQGVLTTVLLVLSSAQHARGSDVDRPVPFRLTAANALVVCASAVFLFSIYVSGAQRNARKRFVRDQNERMAEALDVFPGSLPYFGSRGGPVRWPDAERELWPEGGILEVRDGRQIRWPRRYRYLGPYVDQHMWAKTPDERRCDVHWIPARGEFRVYALSEYGEPRPVWKRSLQRGDGRAFSPESEYFEGEGDFHVLDPQDQTLWHARITPAARFQRLPQHEPVLGLRRNYLRRDWSKSLLPSRAVVIVTGKGRFGWTGEAFEPLPPGVGESKHDERPDPLAGVEIRRQRIDGMTTRVGVHRDGKLVLDEVLETNSGTALGMRAMTVLRAPLLNAVSLGAPRLVWPLDPLLFGGQHWWLFGLSLAWAALLAASGGRTLKALRVPPNRRRLWFVLTLLGGLPCLLMQQFLERRRAYKRVGLFAKHPPLLIRSGGAS